MKNNEKIRVCITGSDGFIGSNLMRYLAGDPNLELIPFVGDLLVKDDIQKFFHQNKEIDQLIHLVGLFEGDFETLMKLNVIALCNLLEVAEAASVKKIIFTSTGAVYGEPINTESGESDPLRPNTFYGLSKKYAEECIEYYSQNKKISYVILRFPNVYGPGSIRGVVYSFLNSIKEKGEVTIYGDGMQSRNFLHVEDACQGIYKAIGYNESDIFNISNPSKITLNDLIDLLKAKKEFKVKYLPANNNLKNLLLDISKAQHKLGFEPKHTELKFNL